MIYIELDLMLSHDNFNLFVFRMTRLIQYFGYWLAVASICELYNCLDILMQQAPMAKLLILH